MAFNRANLTKGVEFGVVESAYPGAGGDMTAGTRHQIWLYSEKVGKTVAQITAAAYFVDVGSAGTGEVRRGDIVYVQGSNGVGVRQFKDDADETAGTLSALTA